MIISLNEKFISNSKQKLAYESNFYLSTDRKQVLQHIPLVQKEKEICINLMSKNNIPVLTSISICSIVFDIYRKNRNIRNILQNTVFRLLMINCFYYYILIDYDKFYSIIYYKQIVDKLNKH